MMDDPSCLHSSVKGEKMTEKIENNDPEIVGSEIQEQEKVEAQSVSKSPTTPSEVQAYTPAGKARLPEGLVLMAVYHFLMSLPGLLVGFILLAVPIPALIMAVDDPIGLTAGLVTLGLISLAFGLSGLLFILAGIGLLKRWNWARWLAIALGMVTALFVPVGTVIGAVVIIYLLSENISRIYSG
jgi:hypothetical protein